MTGKTITITLDHYDAYCLGLWLTEAIKHVDATVDPVEDWLLQKHQARTATETAHRVREALFGRGTAPTAQEAVLREIIDWCHLQPGNYPNWMDRARQAVGDFEGDPGQPPHPSETVAEAAKVTIEHEPCPKCASVNVEPYWWHRGQAWIIICQDCKHEEGREDAEYEAWQVWDEAALRALKGGEV